MTKIVKKRGPKNARSAGAALPDWNLCLYFAGRTAEAATAFRNLKQICEEHLAGRYQIEIIDLMKNPRIAREDQIVAVPTVVRKGPPPVRKVVGDLSNTERALAGLDLRAIVRIQQRHNPLPKPITGKPGPV